MTRSDSYRQMLRASTIVGVASFTTILLGLFRTKVVAVLLGPEGIGLLGLYASLVTGAAVVCGFGTVESGTRNIAEAVGRDDHRSEVIVQYAIMSSAILSSIVGVAAIWYFHAAIAHYLFLDASRALDWRVLSAGVALTVAWNSQTAVLSGLQRLHDIALVNIWVAASSLLLAIALLWIGRERAIAFLVVAGPALGAFMTAAFLLGGHRNRAIQRKLPPLHVARQWVNLVRFGAPIMLASLIAIVSPLIVRTLIQRELGTDALGQFQAAWIISMTYIGFVLQAMASDFYPRLTQVAGSHSMANMLVNEQIHTVLLMAGPLLILILSLAPWLVDVLYTTKFHSAFRLLQWQIMGDVLKLVSWPLGFLLLAVGHSRKFLMSELAGFALYVGVSWWGVGRYGIACAGFAYIAMYMVYLPIVFLAARRQSGFAFSAAVLVHFSAVFVVSLVVLALTSLDEGAGVLGGIVLAALLAVYSVKRLVLLTGSESIVKVFDRLLTRVRQR